MLLLIPCPECDVPAEITDRFSLPSTDGPVEHIVVQCAAGHYFRMAADRLASGAPVSDEPVPAAGSAPLWISPVQFDAELSPYRPGQGAGRERVHQIGWKLH